MSESSPRGVKVWILPGLVLIAITALLVWLSPWLWKIFSDPQVVRSVVQEWGPFAPFAFVLLQVLQVVVFALPGEVTQIAGGYLFGFGLGSVLSVVGIALGSALAFGLSRWLGISFVHRIAGPQTLARFDGLMASPRFIGSLFLFFLIPGIPKDILCYVAGLSRLKFVPFLIISSLARLPGIFGSSLMGKALFQGDWLLLTLVAGGALVLFALGWWFRDPIFALVERYAVVRPPKKEVTP